MMQNLNQSGNKQKARAAQDFVPIKEIRDGVAILKGGGLRLVLIASSVNFALKSEDEQTAMLLQYQNFLNSLDFHIQIFVESRKLDIRPYLETLEALEKDQLNDLLKIQTREYIEFIKKFTESTNIMAKTFFVVVPYDPPIFSQRTGFLRRLFPGRQKPARWQGGESDNGSPRFGEAGGQIDNFDEQRTQLEQRAGVVEQGLARVGVRVVELGTQELVELFFKIFNPGETAAPSLG
ncbi:MAG: hypothetical protein V1704_02185 [Candidatus Vogelbacteria bacterium]